MGAQADPHLSSLQVPSFKTFRVSHYEFGSVPALFPDVEQLQYNVPNLPLFVDGTAPFMGDYIDITGTPQIVSEGDGEWTFNVADTGTAVFHAAWTDNRDVIPPADGNWKNYTPPISASNLGSQPSKFDPTQTPLACVAGQTGMRNQNVYTAEISSGVILTSPQTSKPVLTPAGQPVQREFVVELRNATNAARSFLVTIPAQPTGATASFKQFNQQVTQSVKVNAFSSQSFPVFVVANAGSQVAFPSVLINAAENDGAATPLSGSILLNPDPTNPALANPDNATVGANQISLNEFYNPGVANPGLANPGVANPGVANPGVANPGLANPGVANPQIITALNPGVANPGVANPGVANPGVANPGLANQALTDVSYTITNEGNTSASYTVQFFQSGTLPAGAQFQIILSKLYFTQQAVGCQLQQVPTNVIVANVANPAFVTNPNQVGNPGVANLGLQTPTLNLAPGDSGEITLRTNLSIPQVQSLVLPNLSPVAVSQAVNTVDVKQGIFTPPISLIITSTSASLPVGVVNQSYNTVLTSVGGNTGARIWTITAGSLPPGLQLNAVSGAISGTPTQAGSFPFTAQVMDTGAPQHTATRDLVITVVPPVAITTPSPTLVGGVVGSPYTQSFSAAGGVPTYAWSSTGTLPPGLTLSNTGTLSGMPTTPGTYSFTVTATDSIGLFATAPYTILVASVALPAQIAFVVQPSNSVGSQAISPPVQVQVLDVSGAAIPGVQVAMNFGNPACSTAVLSGSPLATTNASGIASFPNLLIDRGQVGYTLLATAGNATAISNPFTVNGFCPTASLSTPRELHTQVLLGNGKVLIAGGVNNTSNALNTAELYDPTTGTVSPTGNLTTPNGRVTHASIVLPNGGVLLLGGSDSAGSPLASAELYDPTLGTFSATGSMAQARDWANAVLLANGKVLVSGGVGSNGDLNTAEIYDPATGLFTPTGTLNQARARHTMTLLPNGTVLVAGGRTFSGPSVTVFASAEIFDPAANNRVGAFTPIGNMNSPRDEARAMLLPNGTVLLTGGFVSYQTNLSASSSEIFDPASNAFTLTGSMSVARAHQTASLLPDGNVLAAGGVPDTGATTPASRTAEIFNTSTGTFTATGSMTIQREYARAIVLANGNPLISGGDDGVNTTANEEIYYSAASSAPLVIKTASLPNGATGQSYTLVLLEQGGLGALTWTVTGALPPGMNFSNQGILTGTPTVGGSFPLTFTLTDGSIPAKSAQSNLILTVTTSPLVFTSPTVPTAVAGRPYIQALPVAGGTQPYNATVTSGTLPPGLVLISSGVLGGTPSGTGSFTFAVTVTDSSTPTKTATQTFTMALNTLVITTTVLPNGIVGVPYNAGINTAGGILPLSFSLTTAAFPPGLLIQQPAPGASSGALAGTPTLAGTYTFSESVVDSSNLQQTAIQNYVVTIAPAGSAVPANVTFVRQPLNSVGGQTISGGAIVVRVTDANNTPISGTTVAMTLGGIFNSAPPCSVATLSGTLTAVTAATGQATFSNLSIDRGGFAYALLASTGSASGSSGPFSVQGFCASGNLSTPREGHTQDLLATRQSTFKFPLDPKGAYIFTNTNPGPSGVPDLPNAPLIISLASLGIQPGNVISAVPVGDANVCGAGVFCFGEFFSPGVCGVFSSSNTLLPPGGTINRVPGAIAPNFSTAFSCGTSPTLYGSLPTDIPQDFFFSGEPVTVPNGAAYLFVAVVDIFYSDNSDPNGDFGVAITANSSSSVNGKVLIAGGSDNLGNALNTAELYDPALRFTSPTGNLSDPNGRANHVSVVLPNGKVLLIGGVSNVSNLATAELYDPATGTFTPTGSMSQPRGLPAVVLLADGRVLVSGGFNTQIASNTAEIYDPATGLFTPTGNMNQGRGRHQMTLLTNGKVLVTGGRDAQQNFFALASAEIFDPFAKGAGAFTPIGNMTSPRFKHTATLLSNGTVLIAGGFNGGNTSASVATAEIFDPSTSSFTPTGTMNTPRARHTSTLLPDGTVLEAGGINGFNGVIAATPAELYSPASGTFSLTGPMITGREFPAATLLLNGNVLLSGGDDGVNILASTEVYYNPVAQAPVVITTTSVPNAFISQPYVQLLLEKNRSGPITWSLASGTLPPGITLGANGILSGTPSAVGSFTFTVQVTDGISTTTASYTINVSLSTLAFTSSTMPAAGAGRSYSQLLPVTGGTLPYSATVTSGTLPPGLALSSTGILSGTPSGAGSFTFTATVTDSSTPAQTATQTLTIAVNTLFITTTALPSGIVGVPYSTPISTSGGTLPLSFSQANTAFPPGLAIQQPAANSQNGAIAGIPGLAGHYTFTESVVDSSNPAQTATQYYAVDIVAAGTTATPAVVTFLSQPQNSVGGQILTGSPIRVHVTDANNTPIVGASVAVSFNGAPPCSSAVLGGTLNGITNGGGNAVFFDLWIDRGQLGYTLLASAGSASAVSQPFTVNGFCNISALVQVGPFAATTLLSNGKALITGGVDASGNSAVAQLYDPATQTFTPTGSMQLPRREHTSTLLTDGRVLIAGGRGGTAISSPATATAEIYDPIAGTFALTASPMNFPRRLHTATALADGTLLIVGGVGANLSTQNTAEIFDPKSGSFTLLTATLVTARSLHTATLLPDGTVLLAGGQFAGATLSSAEIYNPSVPSFTAVPASMNSPRSLFNAVLLPTGKALLVGGFSDSTGTIATATAELYDPSNATFTLTGSMSTARAYFTANLLPNGQVLASGGLPTFTTSSTGLATAEVYDPITGTFSQTGSMSASHAQQTSVTLTDGTVLVTQGASTGNDDDVYYSAAPLAPLQITTPSLLRGATQGQPYAQVLLEQGGLGSLTWTLTGGSLPSGVTLSPNGILSGTPTVFGAFLFTVQVTDSSVPPKTTTATYALLVNPFFQFFGTQLATAFSGVAYSNPLPLIGGTPPYSSTLTSGVFPSGLGLANDVISGITTAAGTYTLTFQATDSSVPPQSATGTLTLGVTTPLAITTTTLPGGVLNSPYSGTIATSGGLGTIIIGPTANALPPGLAMDLHGVIRGTPTQTGTFTFTVVAFDQSLPPQTFTQPESITITTAAPAGSHILFIIQPGQNTGANGLQALAQLFDANNTPVPGVELTGSFGNKACPDAALSGTLTTVTDSNGLAAFSGISSNRGGNGYTAVASATFNPQVFATSIPFNIQGFCPTGNLTTLRRENTVALLPNGKVLIVGGLNSNSVPATALSTDELYDPLTGIFTATGSMTTPRDLATATVLPSGKMLVVGGYDATSTTLASAELYDPATGVFTATGTMSVPRQEHTATLLPNGKVLIAGGVKWAFPTTFYASAEIYDPATGQFTLTGTMNSPHVDHTATLLSNGKVLVASGEGSTNPDASNQQITSSAELYDLSTGTFTPTGSMTIGRFNQAATTLSDGRVVITGGYADVNTRTATASAEVYDSATGTFIPTGSMNVARAEHTSTLLPNGTVFIGGGFSSGGFFSGVQLSTAETYNPLSGNFKGLANMAFAHSRIVAPLLPNGAVLLTSGANAELFFPADPPFLVQEFTATGSLNTARYIHTATLLPNGAVLIAGGLGSSSNSSASAELYNPATGTFTATANLNTARYYHTATVLANGLVLIAGGVDSSGVSSASAELYDPATGTFTATGSLTTARYQHTATLLPNGTVLMAGGAPSGGGALASAELYDPATGTFTATGSLTTARSYHTATLLNNGLVLIAGGAGPGITLASAELYNPATGTFTATGGLNTARVYHKAALLSNGLVLIAGGQDSSGNVSASAELYNPATGNFTATGSLNIARIYHTATLLNNGLVLIAGGAVPGGSLASAELYDPTTGTFIATGSMNTIRYLHTATLLPTGKVLASGGINGAAVQATAELFQFGANQQLVPQSCSYEGHIKSVAAFSTPAAIQFVNNSPTLTFQVFWLDYNGNRVLYATLSPGQSFVRQTFLTHPWVIADTSPAAACQQIYLPLPELAPAIFP